MFCEGGKNEIRLETCGVGKSNQIELQGELQATGWREDAGARWMTMSTFQRETGVARSSPTNQ
jgi:hypothetical protein